MASSLHILLFPFMSKGHTIPLLDLARLLLRHNATITIITTPFNRPFISSSLSDVTTTIIDLPFPQNIAEIPPNIESTDKLPSMSLFYTFANATKLLQPHFEEAIQNLQVPITFMITDGFLGWTLDSADKFNIPRFAYYGISNFAGAVIEAVKKTGLLLTNNESDIDEVLQVPNFPTLNITKNDLGPSFVDLDSQEFKFVKEQIAATSKSYGLIVNSFYELEPMFSDFWNLHCKPKSWSIGPFCIDQPLKLQSQKPSWITWLDKKLEQGKSVLYVAFGSQAEVSSKQFEQIKIGLEISNTNFLWVIRKNEKELSDGFEERIDGRGMVVKEWVDQREILGHKAVKGFLSHCGWNSVLESIVAAVPILAWPMMAEQHLNARMVVDEIKIGIRVETCDGSVRGFVKWEGLEKTVKELMEGEIGKQVRKKVKEIGESAIKAVEEGGSSWSTLVDLIHEIQCMKA